jgi:hypothetical protein
VSFLLFLVSFYFANFTNLMLEELFVSVGITVLLWR